jgi:pSer/pThr/pTyr-binding forkhead associated (FHA) protein
MPCSDVPSLAGSMPKSLSRIVVSYDFFVCSHCLVANHCLISQAYLIDLGSHHGTHIRKPGERLSRPLKPETPTLLADGDTVTFGKSVGKNEECVKPVVARIELLYSGSAYSTTSPIKPLVVPCSSSPASDKSSIKSNSGRYGIGDTSSSSSDESSFNSGLYSDIEEIPAPTPSSSKPITQNSSSSTASFLKRLLPPSHSPDAPRKDFFPSLSEIVEKPFAQVSMFFSSLGPESVPTSPSGYNYSRLAPIPDLEGSVSPVAFDFLPVGFDASQHDIYEISDHVTSRPRSMSSSRYRSNSPMDLASPSPPREVVTPTPVQLPPLLVPTVTTEESNVLNPATDDPDSSAINDVVSENAVITKDNGADGEATSAYPDDTIPPPSDVVETRDNALTPAQLKKFEEQLEKLQVLFVQLSPDVSFETNQIRSTCLNCTTTDANIKLGSTPTSRLSLESLLSLMIVLRKSMQSIRCYLTKSTLFTTSIFLIFKLNSEVSRSVWMNFRTPFLHPTPWNVHLNWKIEKK